MQVLFLPFFIFFSQLSYIDMGAEFMNHVIHLITANLRNIFRTVCTAISSCIRDTNLRFVLVAAFLGTLNHFLYFLSGQSAIVALFCPVNESVWEHLKLLYFPFLFVSIWEYFSLRPAALHFFYCRYLGVVFGMLFTVFVFYTYSGILGRNFLVLDILLFYSSVIFSFGMSEYFTDRLHTSRETDSTFVISLWMITAFFFFVFTCFPPDLPLFYSA